MTQRIAIPLFGDEVAPRFCFADELLIVDIQGGAPGAGQRLKIGEASWPERIVQLAAAGVGVLLCGGFNRRLRPLAASHRIMVIWGLCGRADKLVEAFCSGELEALQLRAERTAEGGRGAGRGRRRGARRGCGRG